MKCKAAVGLLLLLAALPYVHGNTVYRAPKCERLCNDEKEFELPLPPEPEDDGTTRANKWGIVMLNQIKENIKTLTPPGVARSLAIFSSCLHDAVALGSPDMRPAYVTNANHGDEFDVEEAVDGACFEAISSMFGNQPSFEKVLDFLEDRENDDTSEGSRKTVIRGEGSASSSITIKTTPARKEGTKGNGISFIESFDLGQKVCKQVIKKFTKDGFDTLGNAGPEITSQFPGHEPFNLPQTTAGITDCPVEMKSLDRWQQLCVPVEFGSDECNVQEFLAPFADKMNTFALPSADSVSPPGPPLFEGGDREEWFRQAREVVQFSRNLTDITKITAEHWADGPDSTAPPGHWYRIAMEAAVNEDMDIFDTARVLLVVGNALNDAGVAAWEAKIKFDSIRPLQMIQCGFADELLDAWIRPYEGVGDVPAAMWQPYQATTFVTPAFAGYVSGHSTFSAAAAGALINLFGEAYVAPKCRRVKEGESLFEARIEEGQQGFMDGLTNVANQGPRTKGYAPGTDVVLCWDTWEEASVEAGISRLMGGIHIIADHTDGEKIGFEVADLVFKKAQRLWN